MTIKIECVIFIVNYSNTAVIYEIIRENRKEIIMTMRKIKKAACAAAAVVMMLCLSSCMAMENGIIINNDGTIRVFCDTTVEEEMLASMEMTKEDFVQNIKDSETSESYEGFEIESIENTVDGKSYVGCRYYKDMTTDELNSYVQGDEGVKCTYSLVEEGGKLTVTITYTNSNEGGEDMDEMSQYVAEGMMTTKQSVKAPYEILETNGTADEATGTVTWDTLEVFMGTVKEVDYTVTYKVSSGAPLGLIFGIIAAIIIIAAAVIVFIVIKNNRTPAIPQAAVSFATAETTPVQPSAPVQAPVENTAPQQTEEAQAQEQANEKICEICGAKAGADDQFCPVCGERM